MHAPSLPLLSQVGSFENILGPGGGGAFPRPRTLKGFDGRWGKEVSFLTVVQPRWKKSAVPMSKNLKQGNQGFKMAFCGDWFS